MNFFEKYEKLLTEMLSNIKEKKKDICKLCGHSLKDNLHGWDQNDSYLNEKQDKLIHRGSCTYCKECNPRMREK